MLFRSTARRSSAAAFFGFLVAGAVISAVLLLVSLVAGGNVTADLAAALRVVIPVSALAALLFTVGAVHVGRRTATELVVEAEGDTFAIHFGADDTANGTICLKYGYYRGAQRGFRTLWALVEVNAAPSFLFYREVGALHVPSDWPEVPIEAMARIPAVKSHWDVSELPDLVTALRGAGATVQPGV